MSRVAPSVIGSSVRLSVEEYLRAADAGCFIGQRRSPELINGRIRRMAPQAMPHALAITRLSRVFLPIVPTNEILITQATYRLDERSALDPDLLWVPTHPTTEQSVWPLPLLLIEVSSTTYRYDSGLKLRKYAERGVPEYWIENMVADRFEVYRDPRNPTGKTADCYYASVQHIVRGQSVTMLSRPSVTLEIDALLL